MYQGSSFQQREQKHQDNARNFSHQPIVLLLQYHICIAIAFEHHLIDLRHYTIQMRANIKKITQEEES